MKQLKNILDNKLCIVGVRRRIADLVQLSISDFNRTEKYWIDLGAKKVIGECPVPFTEADFQIIKEYLSENAK